MRKIGTVLLLAGAVIALAAGPASARQVIKATPSDTYDPTPVHVAMGEKVIWKNADIDDHVVKSTSHGWQKDKLIHPGAKTSFTFNSRGRYTYKCTIHLGMKGVIKVG
jgi:plastocyanin